MKVVIPGGTGQIGRILVRAFLAAGHEIVVLGRSIRASPRSDAAAPNIVRFVPWDGRSDGPWVDEIDGADVVVNLAGRSVDCRYTEANRDAILRSRVDSTHAVGRAIAAAASPPSVWLQASTATIYAHRYEASNDEATGLIGGRGHDAAGYDERWRFSIDVAEAWEAALAAHEVPATRRVAMRTSMVMSPDRGGIFDILYGLTRRGLGGASGDGRQYVSWIHDADFVAAVERLLDDDRFSGPVNLASPNPLPNREFMRHLRDAVGAPVGLPATRWMLEAGAVAMRTETELLLKSRRVVPGRLLDAGFDFTFPRWAEAADDLVRRIKSR